MTKIDKNIHTEEQEVHSILRRNGVLSSIEDLRDPDIYPEATGVLLDLFRKPFGAGMLYAISIALFRRSMSSGQKEEAVGICIELCKARLAEPLMELIAGNTLADNASPQHVKKIGEMFLDRHLGEKRDVFARVLGEVANDKSVCYLRAGAQNGDTANFAITELARLIRPQDALQICDTALALSNLRYRKNVEAIRRKLQRKLEKLNPVHLTDKNPPAGLEEWSANIDGSQVAAVLRGIQASVESGFGKNESKEVRSVLDDVNPSEVKTLVFDVLFGGKQASLWIQIKCDDEDAFDFYIFATPQIIREIDSAIHLKK